MIQLICSLIAPRLFDSDFTYYDRVLRRMTEDRDIQFESDPSTQALIISRIKSFENLEKYLPDRVIPEKGNSYFFTTNRDLVMQDIAEARKEETLWPMKNLLWDQHPMMAWLRSGLETIYRRNETPLVTGLETLSSTEVLILFYGQIPNKRGLTVINSWTGLLFDGSVFKASLPLDQLIETHRLHKNNLPNSAIPMDTREIQELLPEALAVAKDVILQERNAFASKAVPYLIDHEQRLSQIRDRRIRQLKLDFSTAIERSRGHEYDLYNQAKDRAEQDYKNYIQWIREHMQTEEDGYIQFTAVFTGVQSQGGLF